jgi:short-subunit dehydrogenase
MRERNEGHIINIGSIAGYEAYPGGSVYCGTKHAVKAITQGAKMDLTGTNIRVSAVRREWWIPSSAKSAFMGIRIKQIKCIKTCNLSLPRT